MTLSKEQIKKFQEIYFNHFGERINDADAYNQGINLINLVKAVYKQPNLSNE